MTEDGKDIERMMEKCTLCNIAKSTFAFAKKTSEAINMDFLGGVQIALICNVLHNDGDLDPFSENYYRETNCIVLFFQFQEVWTHFVLSHTWYPKKILDHAVHTDRY